MTNEGVAGMIRTDNEIIHERMVGGYLDGETSGISKISQPMMMSSSKKVQRNGDPQEQKDHIIRSKFEEKIAIFKQR